MQWLSDFLTQILLLWYLVINVISFIAMFIDKKKAENENWRIPESTLFLTAITGGIVGFWGGMYIFHHKTRKPMFKLVGVASTALHIVLLILIFF